MCDPGIKKTWFEDQVISSFQCRITFCGIFWGLFPLGITCDKKIMTKIYHKLSIGS